MSHEDSRLQTKLGRQKLIYITEGIPFYVIKQKTIESKRAVPAGALLFDHYRKCYGAQQAGALRRKTVRCLFHN